MSRILFQESYIVIVSSFDKTATHKHPFMHLFFRQNEYSFIGERNHKNR